MTKNYFLLIALFISSLSFGQIVTNGDFESWTGGVLDTWTSEAGTTVEQETTIVNGGANAAKFTVTTQTQSNTDFRQTISVEAGKTYDVSVWVYQADNGARARLFVDGYQGYSDPDNLNSWQELTYEYSATATETIDIGLRFYDISSNWAAAGNMSIIYIDDYTVTEQVTTVPSITITAPTASAFAPGTSSVDVEYVTQNIDLMVAGNQVNVTVNMNPTDADVSSPYTIPTADGTTYDVTVELLENNMVVDTKMVSFSIGSETQVANITALRAGTQGEYYEITGEVIISYIVTEGTRNQKYIQDSSGAGILIDDTAGTLSAPLNIGDGMIGLKGRLSAFSGVLQLVPSENVPGASSTGNSVSPIDVTVTELATNGETYESRLIRLIDATFDAGDVGNMFADNTNYDVTVVGGTDMTVARVSFGDEDIIGTTIPSTHVNIIGLGGEFNGTYQVLPRYASDIENALSTEEFGAVSFSMYPNPTNGSTVTISSASNSTKEVKVYSIIGKQVINTTITNTLNVADLKSGIYVVQITENGKSATKKLVIK